MLSRSKRTSLPKKHSVLHIVSDFDNTIVPVNTASLLARTYFSRNPHHEPLYRRLGRTVVAAAFALQGDEIEQYYTILRRVPLSLRHEVLRAVPIHPRWLAAVKQARLRHRAKRVRITILTRNCIDVVHDWVMQNAHVLAKDGIQIEMIIANGPLNENLPVLVRERAGLRHIDYVGFGRLHAAQKRLFVDKRTIYLGDVHERMLRPLVKTFLQI